MRDPRAARDPREAPPARAVDAVSSVEPEVAIADLAVADTLKTLLSLSPEQRVELKSDHMVALRVRDLHSEEIAVSTEMTAEIMMMVTDLLVEILTTTDLLAEILIATDLKVSADLKTTTLREVAVKDEAELSEALVAVPDPLLEVVSSSEQHLLLRTLHIELRV